MLYLIDRSQSPPPEYITDSSDKSILNSHYDDWILLDQQLLDCLFATLSETILYHVLHTEQAHDVWLVLEGKLSSLSHNNIFHLKNRLLTISKGTSLVQEYLQ